MNRVLAKVQGGQIVLPDGIELPDGLQVRVVWDEVEASSPPLERDPWTKEEVQHEIERAKGHQWPDPAGS